MPKPTAASSTAPERRVGYVMTHYPKLAQTFIRAEIAGLEQRGVTVVPMALNRGEEIDVALPADRREMERTRYLKDGGPRDAVRAFMRAMRCGRRSILVELLDSAKYGGPQLRTKLWRSFHFAEALIVWDHCVSNDVRHLHAQFAGPTATVAQLAVRLGNALTPDRRWTMSITIHGNTDFMNEDDIDLRSKLRDSSFLVVISDFLKAQSMRVSDPADWHKIHVVRVGIDPLRFAPRPTEPDNAVPRIACVGRFSSEKGQIVLLEAIAQLAAAGRKVVLDLVGDGPMAGDLRDAVARLGIEESVEFRGELPPTEVAELLAASDLFCLPSFLEGIPVSIMEAMAVGVPVVSTSVMGIPELVVDGETGFTFTASRSDLLADAIERCLADPERRRSVIDAARARVAELHDQSTNLDQLAEVFETVV